MTWMLSRARVDDLDAIMSLETATFGSDAWPVSVMRSELQGEHTHYMVARPTARDADVGAIDGYAGLLAPAGAPQSDIQTIAVAPTARRRGLGRVFVQTLMAEAYRRGAQETFLEVRADNPGARALYESLGFTSIGVRPRYYQPDGVDAIMMRAVLTAPVTRPADPMVGGAS